MQEHNIESVIEKSIQIYYKTRLGYMVNHVYIYLHNLVLLRFIIGNDDLICQ